MSEVSLERQGLLQEIPGRRDDLEVEVKVDLEIVIVTGGASRVELLELTDRANEEVTGEIVELLADSRLTGAGGRTLVEQPTTYGHISSDPRTLRSVRSVNRLR